jgi:hypothetical protein
VLDVSTEKTNMKAIRTAIKRKKFSSHELREDPSKNIDGKEMVSRMYNVS